VQAKEVLRGESNVLKVDLKNVIKPALIDWLFSMDKIDGDDGLKRKVRSGLYEKVPEKIRNIYTQVTKNSAKDPDFGDDKTLVEDLIAFLDSDEAEDMSILEKNFNRRLLVWDGQNPDDFSLGVDGSSAMLFPVLLGFAAHLELIEIQSVNDDFVMTDKLLTSFMFGFLISMLKGRSRVVKQDRVQGERTKPCDKIVETSGESKKLTTWLYDNAKRVQVTICLPLLHGLLPHTTTTNPYYPIGYYPIFNTIPYSTRYFLLPHSCYPILHIPYYPILPHTTPYYPILPQPHTS
jgi:hypothetical protein